MRPLSRRQALTLAAGAAAAVAAAGPATARPPAPQTVAPLPAGFRWGVASAGFQCEGHAPDSNWLRYADRNPAFDRYGDSVDFFGRYRDDIALAAGLGVGVYRISIEWARVQPRPGEWDENGFAFYDRVLDAMAAAGLQPMLTLDHWVYPGWVADYGGWANPAMVDDWLAHARVVVDRYASRNPLWVTVNEPFGYIMNETRNGGVPAASVPAMRDGIIAVHNGIYDYIHQVQPGAWVTTNVPFMAGGAEPLINTTVTDAVAARMDYVGIDYYYGFTPQQLLTVSPDDLQQLWNMPLQPEGIYYALDFYARRYPGKPLYIVEGGIPTHDGAPRADGITRADALRDSVYWIQRAVADGIPVAGYNYWSLTDNYEWGSYAPRFGLYTVDVTTDPTLTRRPTDAVAAYTEITAAGGVPAGYRPTLAPVACSMSETPQSCLDPVTLPG
ncbi:family 1 glycosylhydrolase [Nocardia stercoris]|uniref:Glycoside hydrolase family 1 protein n=1 Tax=Nocardia stercoris TaxID=2483361 RepID=A0A3M2L0V6_9NOCA|nr:family 1 glycosylhydrolase [Nocardia stercoris]RMI29435.1 glycoside hydrolase family 1 protein [Nocardia stercoris]